MTAGKSLGPLDCCSPCDAQAGLEEAKDKHSQSLVLRTATLDTTAVEFDERGGMEIVDGYYNSGQGEARASVPAGRFTCVLDANPTWRKGCRKVIARKVRRFDRGQRRRCGTYLN